jgi:hypothetical protein
LGILGIENRNIFLSFQDGSNYPKSKNNIKKFLFFECPRPHPRGQQTASVGEGAGEGREGRGGEGMNADTGLRPRRRAMSTRMQRASAQTCRVCGDAGLCSRGRECFTSR